MSDGSQRVRPALARAPYGCRDLNYRLCRTSNMGHGVDRRRFRLQVAGRGRRIERVAAPPSDDFDQLEDRGRSANGRSYGYVAWYRRHDARVSAARPTARPFGRSCGRGGRRKRKLYH